MESLIAFIENWGYWAVFGGSLIEGESIILTASAMASQGYLSIYNVALIAFVGTTIADQALYYVGRYYGDAIFKRFPKLVAPSKRAFDLLHKYDIWFIIACRFIYGIRVTSAIVIGAAKIPPARFIPLNILSAAIWATVSCSAGYFLGSIVFDFFIHSENIQRNIIFRFIPAVMIVFGIYKAFQFIRSTLK